MIKFVIKRDGRIEAFDASKINKWGEWASRTLGEGVAWSEVVLHVFQSMPDTVTSEDLQDSLIKYCVNKRTWEYNRMAGRLYAALSYKQIYNKKSPPTIKEVHTNLVNNGLMVELNYTDDEYGFLETIINHKLDLKYSHYELQQLRYKYALRNKKTGEEYETPQFIYMRMAMALGEDESKDVKLKDVIKWYEHFSNKRINPPTPNFVNLGTNLKGYTSCCLYTTDDNVHSLAAGDHIAYMMTCMSAGIGSNIKTRSIGEPVRNGLIRHQGKLPYYRSLVGAIGANQQNGRVGASTVHYTCYDPEVEVIQKLKNPMTPTSKQVRGVDYSFGVNKFFAKKVAKNEDIHLFSCHQNKDLYEAQYDKDENKFEELYEKFINNEKSTSVINARKLLVGAINEAYETGRHYLHMTDTINKHTPFKDKIYQSNLCVAGNTKIDIEYDGMYSTIDIKNLSYFLKKYKSVKVLSYNINSKEKEFKKIKDFAMTSKKAKVLKISYKGKQLVCTPEHKIFTKNRGYVEAGNLLESDELVV